MSDKITNINHLVNHPTDAVTDLMDGLVHDTASQAASAANNEGLEGQMYFLLGHGWSVSQILDALNETLSEEEVQDVLNKE